MSSEIISNNAKEFRQNNGIPDYINIPKLKEYKYNKEQLDNLRNSVENAKEISDKQKIVDEFFNKKEGIKNDTKNNTHLLKETLDNLSVKNLKQALDIIEKEENVETKIFHTNLLIGAIEKEGYKIRLDNESVIIEDRGNNDKKLEYQTLINNYIKNNINILDNFKAAILRRTTKLDDYIQINTDSKGNLNTDKMNSRNYYDFLMKKYKLDEGFNFSDIDAIKNHSGISEKDKDFLISYKQNAFDNYQIGPAIKQYSNEINSMNSKSGKIEGVISSAISRIPGDSGKKAKKAFEDDKRDINQKISDFIKDPFSEILKISSNAGSIGGLAVIGALIYFAFTEPKKVFSGIALWGLAKGTGIADYTADEFGKNIKGNSNEKKPEQKAKKEEEIKLTPSQQEATKKVKDNSNLVSNINKFSEKSEKKGNTEDYLKFINSQKFQEKQLNKIIYPEIKENSIFSNSNSIDPTINLENNLDPIILKQILRVYLGIDYKFSIPKEGKKPGEEELFIFESKYLPKKQEEKEKKFSELLNIIYSKKS